MNANINQKIRKHNIVYERVSKLIEENNLNQKTFSELLSEKEGRPLTSTNVSLWTTGRRNVPLKYLHSIASILNTEEPYLLGLTDNPSVTWGQLEESMTRDTLDIFAIDYCQLYAYDKQPVFVIFIQHEHEDGWAIYNRALHIFIFAGDVIKESTIKEVGGKIFVKDVLALNDPLKQKKSLNYAGMMVTNPVYVYMTTSDASVHSLYDGWYRHNENKTALINSEGLVLPYSGLKKSFLVYSYGYRPHGEE